MRNVILFGPMGAGKDTVAEMLVTLSKRDFPFIMKLGDATSQSIRNITGHTPNRTEMQEYGQFCRKLFGEDIWCKQLMADLALALDKPMAPLIISDGRQPNELTFFKDKGFIPIGVNAPLCLRLKRVEKRDGYSQAERSMHETESNALRIIQYCNAIIYNDGTLDELEDKVREVYYDLLH